ncbi:hypothetical protein DXG01_010005 [Tephrocybe rancida]|nr:hypothetical protein DXG01_010005 [Tephrocybe rancida]
MRILFTSLTTHNHPPIMFSKTFFALAILVSGALAQSGMQSSTAAEPSASLPPGISQCILDCIQPAAESVNCAITDFPCVCASAAFLDAVTNCLQAQCTNDDINAALALQAQECGASSVTGSATTGSGATSTVASPMTTPSGNTSVAPPVSTSPSATPTAPTTSPTTTAAATAPATTTSNAAVDKKESMGLVGLVIAGVFGLVL